MSRYKVGEICININKTERAVSEIRGPALGFMSDIDKNSAYIFCKDNCIGLPQGPKSEISRI